MSNDPRPGPLHGAPVPGGRPGRVLSNRTIMICAALLVLLAGALAWLLLANYGDGSAANNARLDGIRTVGTIVLGAGGAIALLLAARRQQTAEHDLAEKRRDLVLKERVQLHAEKVAETTEADAVARRITELYTKAVEQLGASKAPVRLGGLYALERLAQDNESQRQTIISVLCAYLRMPYDIDPPPTDPPPSSGTGVDADKRLPMEPNREAVREHAQERQVRLTAQRILTDHLTPGDDPDNPVITFWDHATLDLTGATLINFNLAKCHFRTGQFRGATFTGDAWFTGATFTGDARFNGATFTGASWFHDATFTGGAWFHGATFTGEARFYRVTFTGEARFNGATFTEGGQFYGATFTRGATFDEACARTNPIMRISSSWPQGWALEDAVTTPRIQPTAHTGTWHLVVPTEVGTVTLGDPHLHDRLHPDSPSSPVRKG